MTIPSGPIMLDAERARAFVLAHGGLRDQARLEGIFGRTPPDRQVTRELEQGQNPDGGFPAQELPGCASSIESTCRVLAQLKDLPPLAGSPSASRAVAYLRRMQAVDGSWGETDRANLTALAVYTILTLDPSHMDPILRGLAWLRQAGADGQTGGALGPQALASVWACWYRTTGPDSEEAVRAFDLLRQQTMTADDLIFWLTCAREVSAGGRYLMDLVTGLGRLAGMQQADGSWPADAGSPVESTLGALRVFQGYTILRRG